MHDYTGLDDTIFSLLPGLLLDWYDHSRRDLPWRARPGHAADPYHIWLSEIMLQQTTVEAVIPYYKAFLRKFPSLEALAQAPQEEVLLMWAGLGYYARARHLHMCAQRILEDFGGHFPEDETVLLKLPGIGLYTAGAIASIAFNRPAVALDGNAYRILARVFGVETPLPKAAKQLRSYAERLLPLPNISHARYGDLAQAFMDLGSAICRPKNPQCRMCPWQEFCQAYVQDRVLELPRKRKAGCRPTRYGVAFVARSADGSWLVRTRPPRGLLGGMTEVPTTVWGLSPASGEKYDPPFPGAWQRVEESVEHIFSHFRLILTVYKIEVVSMQEPPLKMRWVQDTQMKNEAFPSVMNKVLRCAFPSGIDV
jgi:A/G-specific adenine glycosylase